MGITGLFAVVLMILYGAVVLMKRARGRDVSTSGFGPFDEVFHPAAHEVVVVIEEQEKSAPPVPAPDDK
ncbi:MAG: hypothetical protein L0K86_24850 [Actinomycetia bacterium]|nr:hypothetical protein [Actinomycetes bacterium]